MTGRIRNLGPRKPESKGQVERTIGYLETSFLPLRSFADLADLQAQHDDWTHRVAFRRHHRRVGARVGDAYRVERGFLAPLPDPLPDTDRYTEVRVTKDGSPRTGSAVSVTLTTRCHRAWLDAGSRCGSRRRR